MKNDTGKKKKKESSQITTKKGVGGRRDCGRLFLWKFLVSNEETPLETKIGRIKRDYRKIL